MNKFYILLVFACLFALCSCEQTITNVYEENYTLELSRDTVLFNVGGGLKSVEILTNQDSWETAYEDDIWFTSNEFRNADGYEMITIEADSCKGFENRESLISVTAGRYQANLHVIQIGNKPTIYLGRDTVSIDKDTTVINFTYVSNIDFDIANSADWVQAEKIENEEDEDFIRLLISRNETGESRETVLAFKQTDGEYIKTLSVMQSADLEAYEPIDINEIRGNKKIPVLSGNATSTLGNFSIDKAFDDDYDTYFQSDWQETGGIEFSFKLNAGSDKLNYIVYHPSEEAANQSVKMAFLYVKKVGEDAFNQVGFKVFSQTQPTGITFNTPLEDVDEVKFNVLQTYGKSGSVPSASCAEVEFYTASALYDAIFTDNTCSELISEVTIDNILNIGDEFYKNLAKHLYNGTYENDRIQDLQAVQVDRHVAKINKASLFEYATGISFSEGEEVVVFCGEYTGNAPSLLVLNSEGMNEYPLIEGVNKIMPIKSGKVYINNPVDVKIHIAGGVFEGVYDVGDLSPIMDKEDAGFDVVDIMGIQSHLIMPLTYAQTAGDLLSSFETNINSLINAAQIFYGVNEGDYMVQSRLGISIASEERDIESLVNLDSSEFEAVSNYSGEYSEAIFSVLEKLGSAYEPYLNKLWGIEGASSKLFALDYFYENNGGKSIIKEEELYGNAFQNIIVVDENYLNVEDKWLQVVPLWQLHRYLKDSEEIHNYYAQLANRVKQLMFIGSYTSHLSLFTNQIANLDFTAFFNKWNMGTPSFKPAMLAPGGLAYYIEDNEALYLNPGNITQGWFSPSLGGYPTLYNWQNITALEVYNAGFLAHVETYQPGIMFQVKWNKYKSNMKIVAIGPNGDSIQAN